jgi:hypothetical protein
VTAVLSQNWSEDEIVCFAQNYLVYHHVEALYSTAREVNFENGSLLLLFAGIYVIIIESLTRGRLKEEREPTIATTNATCLQRRNTDITVVAGGIRAAVDGVLPGATSIVERVDETEQILTSTRPIYIFKVSVASPANAACWRG